MKIVYFNYMADLYGYSIGSTIKAQKLFSALQHHGHRVKFFWLAAQEQSGLSGQAGEKHSARSSFIRNLLFTPKQLARNIIQFFREARILARENPDLLIVRLDAFRISALWAARLYQLPLIVEADGASSYEWLTFNNGPHLWPRVLLWCERLMLDRSLGVFTQSGEAKRYFVRQHHIAPEKIRVITNGADPVAAEDESNVRELQQKLGIARDSKVIGFLGSMHHWHGVADVPPLIDKVLTEFDDAVFLFIGSGGALQKDLQNSISAKYTKRVVFTGFVPNDEASRYIELFTIAIAPYPKIELFYFSPMKIFEYMAAGKAIVAARIGQVSKVIRDGENGLLYEPGNIADLQSKLLALLRDEAKQKKLSENARQTFLQGYTWARKARELDDFLRQCTEQ